MDTYKQTGTVTNKLAQDILNSSAAMATLREQTGMQLPDTAAGRRNAVKAAVAQLAQQPSSAADNPDTTSVKTNAISKPLDSYPVGKQRVIRSYIRAVDEKLKSFIQNVKSGDLRFKRQKISDVSERAVSDIGNLLGIDVSGYTNNINTHGVQHIINRHGERGKQDTSMAIEDDIARVGWVLENYDNVELLTENGKQVYSSEFLDTNHEPAPQIRFVKRIDGTYYVVEAAFENDYKKIWVQSAYLQKNEDVTQTPAEGKATNHETNARSASASPSSNISIPQTPPSVNPDSNASVGDVSEAWSPGAHPTSREALAWVLENKELQKIDPRTRTLLQEYGRHLQQLQTIAHLQSQLQPTSTDANTSQLAGRNLAKLEQLYAHHAQRLAELEKGDSAPAPSKFQFIALFATSTNQLSFRASDHTGVGISSSSLGF